MASCKDCLHVEVCVSYVREAYKRAHLASSDLNSLRSLRCDDCEHFKDRSRFVELPCKVGDTVYVLCKQIVCDTVDGIAIEKFPDSSIRYQIYCEKSRATYEFKDFGKTIFLSREEAEQALKEREENA